jgi:diphosphomevalonate decarboxylase
MNKHANADAAPEAIESSGERTHVPAEFADSAAGVRAADAEIRTALADAGITWQQCPRRNWNGNAEGSATAKAFAMQGILKYHGLADWHWRTAFVPSISVNNDAAYTITRVDFEPGLITDILTIDGKPTEGRPLERVTRVLHHIRVLAGSTSGARVQSRNVLTAGIAAKGLGTSAAAGAALATAALAAALGPEAARNLRLVSCSARLLAGSACRSTVGGLALWLSYPGIVHDDCFAVRMDDAEQLADLRLLTVPLESRAGLQTEQAHRVALSSAFFRAWMQTRRDDVLACLRATSRGDWEALGRLAEVDSMRLHGVTMSADREQPLVAWEPENISLFHMCHRLRAKGVPVYFSTDTGPTTVFLTHADYQHEVMQSISALRLGVEIIPGHVAGPATLLPPEHEEAVGL